MIMMMMGLRLPLSAGSAVLRRGKVERREVGEGVLTGDQVKRWIG